MKVNAENGGDKAEFLWVELSETGAAEFDRGRFAEAVQQWQNAYDIAQDFDDGDPRLASSLNNLAVAYRINAELAAAEQSYRHSLDAWQAASHWVDRMRLEARARSSLFHLRMERKHREQYDRIALKKYEKLLPAGQAATHNNLAELFHITDRLQDAERLYRQALQERVSAMGANEPGAALIRNNIASLADVGAQPAELITSPSHQLTTIGPFSTQAIRQRWIVDRPAEFTDEGRIMAALLLAQVIDHLRLCATVG
ncbi:MAG: tetratricopeptide repeat protein [Acidiferrobacterales bacterium]